jgi:hypothetical protein
MISLMGPEIFPGTKSVAFIVGPVVLSPLGGSTASSTFEHLEWKTKRSISTRRDREREGERRREGK